MTLNEALSIVNHRKTEGNPEIIFLACGFQPLHLSTFLQAHVIERLGRPAQVVTGLYGDAVGNIEKARASKATAAAVALEWEDLDPRLGLRAGGGWRQAVRADIETTVHARTAQLISAIRMLAESVPVALAAPSLPLPPLGHTGGFQAATFELSLSQTMAAFLTSASRLPGVRVLNPAMLPADSGRLDVKLALLAGFPYSLAYTDFLAGALTGILYPPASKKGLIVDLDDTLWAGIVGEVGVDRISWHQELHTQTHALLQQMLGQLAENGVLLAIASKNEPDLVQQALARQDLLVPHDAFYPVVVNWGPKSLSIKEVLRVWNVGPDSVVFLDDNPLELSEVQASFPEITCLRFNGKAPPAVWDLLIQLRNVFGKPVIFEEDRLRLASLRSAEVFRDVERQGASAAFLRTLDGRLRIDYRKDPQDKRPLELINKTNQFNLNGIRITEGEWAAMLRDTASVATAVSYEDKFGTLGKIATLLGRQQGQGIQVTSWVMSCRAFSRKIEHHTLDSLFRTSGAGELLFDYRPTERNQPLQQFFQEIGFSACEPAQVRLSREQFLAAGHELPHEVTETLA